MAPHGAGEVEAGRVRDVVPVAQRVRREAAADGCPRVALDGRLSEDCGVRLGFGRLGHLRRAFVRRASPDRAGGARAGNLGRSSTRRSLMELMRPLVCTSRLAVGKKK